MARGIARIFTVIGSVVLAVAIVMLLNYLSDTFRIESKLTNVERLGGCAIFILTIAAAFNSAADIFDAQRETNRLLRGFSGVKPPE